MGIDFKVDVTKLAEAEEGGKITEAGVTVLQDLVLATLVSPDFSERLSLSTGVSVEVEVLVEPSSEIEQVEKPAGGKKGRMPLVLIAKGAGGLSLIVIICLVMKCLMTKKNEDTEPLAKGTKSDDDDVDVFRVSENPMIKGLGQYKDDRENSIL